MNRILISSYPNREIRVTLVRQIISQKQDSTRRSESDLNDETDPSLTCPSLKTLNGAKESHGQGVSGNLSLPGHGRSPRFQKFSIYGRRQIVRAGGALQRLIGHDKCLFLTLTHPGSTKVSMKAIADYSGMIVRLFQAWISRHIPNKLSIYTWEWQRRGALHLHMVLGCPDKEKGEWLRSHLQEEWIRILDRVSEESGVDVYRKNEGFSWTSDKSVVKVDAQWCEKDVAGYLSKYVSKATKNNHFLKASHFCPSRWYGVSRPLLSALREMTFSFALDSVRTKEAWGMYEDCLSLLRSTCVKCYEYKHQVGVGKTIVSYSIENEQESIWETIMTQICPTQDSSSNIEQNIRRLARNGCILLKRHKTWLREFMSYYGNSRPANLLNSPSFKSLTRSDLIFLVDSLAYSFRSHQRTRSKLPGECQLWYSQMKNAIDTLRSSEDNWAGYLEL